MNRMTQYIKKTLIRLTLYANKDFNEICFTFPRVIKDVDTIASLLYTNKQKISCLPEPNNIYSSALCDIANSVTRLKLTRKKCTFICKPHVFSKNNIDTSFCCVRCDYYIKDNRFVIQDITKRKR